MPTRTLAKRSNYDIAASVSAAAIVAGILLWTISRQTPQPIEWRPAFCATFLSKDNVPLAVCSDYFYPVYDVVPSGYLGQLEGCVIGSGRIGGCRPTGS